MRGSLQFVPTLCVQRASRLVLTPIFIASALLLGGGCTGDGGGGSGSDTDWGTGGSGGEDDSGLAPLVCDVFTAEANTAAAVPGCNGSMLGAPPTLDGITQAELDDLEIVLPGKMATSDPALVGAWSEVIQIEGSMPIHAIHRPTGRFLQFGRHNHGSGTPTHDHEAVWFPPTPCSPFEHNGDIGQCEKAFDILPTVPGIQSQHSTPVESDLFCAGHINLVPRTANEQIRPRLLTVGGQLSSGGNHGINRAYFFWERMPDTGLPQTSEWEWLTMDDFNRPRWYPTTSALADRDQSAVVGGVTRTHVICEFPDGSTGIGEECACDPMEPAPFEACRENALYTMPVCDWLDGEDGLPIDPNCREQAGTNHDVEILVFDAQNQPSWTLLENAIDDGVQLSYPEMFVIPDLPHLAQQGRHWGGKLLYVGAEVAGTNQRDARLFDPSDGFSSFALGGPSCVPGSAAIQYSAGKFLKFGGGGTPSRAAVVLDLTDPDVEFPLWRAAGTTSMRRRYSSGVLAPDGSTIVTGGTMRGALGDPNPQAAINERYFTVYTTDRFDPETETWCRLADVPALPDSDEELPTLRGYHSQSVLLRGGEIFLGAGGFTTNVDNHFTYQIYYPPYLFWGPRPEIDVGGTMVLGYPDVPPVMQTGTTFPIDRGNAVPIERVTMIKLASSTHNWDMEQRFLELEIQQNTSNAIVVAAPPSTCYATPGPYMVFAISDQGVPSIGQYVYVDGSCAAADVPAVPPPLPVVDVQGMNDRHAGSLVVSSGALATLDLRDFRRSPNELCAAIGDCPSNGTVNFDATLVESSSERVPQYLDDGIIRFVNGDAVLIEPLQIVVSGTGHSGAQLRAGTHTIELCATLDRLKRCIRQPLVVQPALAGPDGLGRFAGEIEQRFRPLRRVAHATKLALGDDDVVFVNFPPEFTFPYQGHLFSRMWIGANGGIRFTSGTIGALNRPLGTGVGPHIAPFWDDLDPSEGGGVYVGYHGDRMVVSWEDVPHKRGTVGGMSFQVHLIRDGRIEFHYPDTYVGAPGVADLGASATIGIQGLSGGAPSLTLSFDDDAWLSSGASAAAIEEDAAVAGELWFPDNVPCEIRPLLEPVVQREICAANNLVSVPVPALPTTCQFDGELTMTGHVIVNGSPVPVIRGRVAVPAGQHELRWRGMVPRQRHHSTPMYPVTSDFVQTLEVVDVCPT